jgi:hypothetical protein
MKRTRVASRILKAVALIVIVLALSFWIMISSKVVGFSMAENTECRWQLNQWHTGRCVFSYYENGARKGVLRTYKGLFERPVAVFPGSDNQSVICIYELDTTIAVFTIELSKADSAGIAAPQSLKDTILFSNFRVRACTKAEVAYLRNHISSTRGPLWRNAFAIFGSKVDPEQARQSLLRALDMGTIPQEERKGEWLYYSHPQIVPEG